MSYWPSIEEVQGNKKIYSLHQIFVGNELKGDVFLNSKGKYFVGGWSEEGRAYLIELVEESYL